MKRHFFLSILIITALALSSVLDAQTGKLPPFLIMQANGKMFRAQNLPPGKPIVMIYFSPDCEECQKLTKELIERIDEFWGVSIAMITYFPVEMVAQYVTKNNLGKYPNIYVGTEGSSLFVRNYYDITLFPFMTLYNKNGDLIVKYTSKQVSLNDLLIRIKKL